MAKAFARKFYSSKIWQECRNEYARRHHYLCERCLSRGLFVPGVIVHHKIELTPENINDASITLNPDNLELLCRDCHAEEHEHDGGRWAAVNEHKRAQRAASQRYKIDKFGHVSANNPPSVLENSSRA